MNSRQKEVIQYQLDSEKEVLDQLQKQYQKALDDIDRKIRILESDELTQSRVYRIEYQKALKMQVEGILEKLHSDEYTTIQQFLSHSYTDAFVGTIYDLFGQGVPFIMPIDNNAAVKAVITDSKISEGLYDALGVDTKKLKNSIRAEISRGIAAGMPHSEIARNIASAAKAPLSRAKTIVRTESHRIAQASKYDAQKAAKAKGADIVRQWDSTLDGKTRDSHRRLDGQIKELDEPFKLGNKEAMYPGDFNDPAEDCNCRCELLQRARVALDEEELRTLQERAEFFGLDKTEDFADFRNKYIDTVDSIFSIENHIKDLDLSSMTVEEANQAIRNAMYNLQTQTEKMDYPYGLVFGNQAYTASVQVDKDSTHAFLYNPRDDVVYVNPYDISFSDYDFNEAMLHELAHRYDRTVVESWKSQSFKSSLTIAKEYVISNMDSVSQIVMNYSTDYYLQDIISIVSDGSIDVFAGHGKLGEDSQAREVFANLSSLRARNAESYEVLKATFPDLIKEFELLFGGE